MTLYIITEGNTLIGYSSDFNKVKSFKLKNPTVSVESLIYKNNTLYHSTLSDHVFNETYEFNDKINNENTNIPDLKNIVERLFNSKTFTKNSESLSIPPDTNTLKVGDKVEKIKGYKFDGIIVSIFETTKGETRVVAELENNGMLHIFNPNQLRKRNE